MFLFLYFGLEIVGDWRPLFSYVCVLKLVGIDIAEHGNLTKRNCRGKYSRCPA
jgi:hypothetical protein